MKNILKRNMEGFLSAKEFNKDNSSKEKLFFPVNSDVKPAVRVPYTCILSYY